MKDSTSLEKLQKVQQNRVGSNFHPWCRSLDFVSGIIGEIIQKSAGPGT